MKDAYFDNNLSAAKNFNIEGHLSVDGYACVNSLSVGSATIYNKGETFLMDNVVMEKTHLLQVLHCYKTMLLVKH